VHEPLDHAARATVEDDDDQPPAMRIDGVENPPRSVPGGASNVGRRTDERCVDGPASVRRLSTFFNVFSSRWGISAAAA
jgi:hypothetical protein